MTSLKTKRQQNKEAKWLEEERINIAAQKAAEDYDKALATRQDGFLRKKFSVVDEIASKLEEKEKQDYIENAKAKERERINEEKGIKSISFSKQKQLKLSAVCLSIVLIFGICFAVLKKKAANQRQSEDDFIIPEFQGMEYVELNNNIPFFILDDYSVENCVSFSELDELGRCGAATAVLHKDLMPSEERPGISNIRPAGFKFTRYDDLIEDGYLYNRCHLIGYQFIGDNSPENLMTGTQYFNVYAMLPFENKIAEYLKTTSNHLLYRVTPVYFEDDLIAEGVILEAMSMEDEGEGIKINVFIFNYQPGIAIDYASGNSYYGKPAENMH